MNKFRMLAVAAAAAIFATGGGPTRVDAQQGTKPFFQKGGIRGRAVDARGKPISGVTVVVSVGPAGTESDSATFFTDSVGNFSLFPLQPATYYLTAYFSNVKVTCEPLKVKESEGEGNYTTIVSVDIPDPARQASTYKKDCFYAYGS